MAWTYEQSLGRMMSQSGVVIANGYSGAGDGKNNPTEEYVKNIGPIPAGSYTVGPPIDSPIHGPFALPLLPDLDNDMYGRSGFMMHGDSLQHPGNASEGCIIMPRFAREQVWNGGDHRIVVVKELPTTT